MQSKLETEDRKRKADFIKSFPYPAAREIQAQALQVLSDNWDKYDVFVLKAPTAFGKTAVAKAVMNGIRSVSVITPTNMLVDQFIGEFPDTKTLARLDSYYCEEWKRPCPVTRGKLLKFCKGCPASCDLSEAKYRKGPGVYNYHTYLAHKVYRKVLVVDEAHNLIPTIKDRLAQTIWMHDYRYPSTMYSVEQMKAWVRTLPDKKRAHKKIRMFEDSLHARAPEYVIERTKDWFNGKGTLRGEPEQRDCIKLIPVDISSAPPMFWPGVGRAGGEVEKVILLSATINEHDIKQLGLGGRSTVRVLHINCKSPIPAPNRPIVPLNILSVNRQNMEEALPVLAHHIEGIAGYHAGEKGIVHATYQLSQMLRSHLTSDRFMFHTRLDKREKYEEFRASPLSSGKILIACGMYEGIDLPEDLGRFQVISKIPWMSLGSPAVAYQAEVHPELYIWETLKTVIQACGRICRTPEDYGATYVLDGTWERLIREAGGMVPEWFRDAILTPDI